MASLTNIECRSTARFIYGSHIHDPVSTSVLQNSSTHVLLVLGFWVRFCVPSLQHHGEESQCEGRGNGLADGRWPLAQHIVTVEVTTYLEFGICYDACPNEMIMTTMAPPPVPPQLPQKIKHLRPPPVTLTLPICEKEGKTETKAAGCDDCQEIIFYYEPTDVPYVTKTTTLGHGPGPTVSTILPGNDCDVCEGTVIICEPAIVTAFPGHPDGTFGFGGPGCNGDSDGKACDGNALGDGAAGSPGFPGSSGNGCGGSGDGGDSSGDDGASCGYETIILPSVGPDGPRITVPPTAPGEPTTIVIGTPGFQNDLATITAPGGAGPGAPTRTLLPTGSDGEAIPGASPSSLSVTLSLLLPRLCLFQELRMAIRP